MSTMDNGAIDYRKRLRDRREQREAVQVATTVIDVVSDPPLAHGAMLTAEDVQEVLGATSSVPAPPADVIPSRTPQVVREQAKAAMTQLLSVSDETYTAMMTELSMADPILYAAVVDEINDARAAETKTA